MGEVILHAKATRRIVNTPATWSDEQAAVGATFDAPSAAMHGTERKLDGKPLAIETRETAEKIVIRGLGKGDPQNVVRRSRVDEIFISVPFLRASKVQLRVETTEIVDDRAQSRLGRPANHRIG